MKLKHNTISEYFHSIPIALIAGCGLTCGTSWAPAEDLLLTPYLTLQMYQL